MLATLEKRVGKKAGATVTVDRGMAYGKNVEEIRQGGYHYLVAARPEERWDHEPEFAEEAGWEEVVRQPSPTNPFQKKTQVWIKQCLTGEEVHVLCVSEQRKGKDRAIRERQKQCLLADLESLSRRISVEKTFLDQGIHTSWASLREQLATHQVVTIVLPTSDGQQIRIRKATAPEPEHKRIYQVLRIPEDIMETPRPRRT